MERLGPGLFFRRLDRVTETAEHPSGRGGAPRQLVALIPIGLALWWLLWGFAHTDLTIAARPAQLVFFSLAYDAPMNAGELASRLAEEGVLCHPLGGDSIRMVTHYHISDENISRAVEITEKVLGS